MGRPRTPTALLESRGAYTRHPERREQRALEPVDTRPLGDCPGDFTEAEEKAWRDLLTAAPSGVLKEADRPLVEMAAKAYAAVREREMSVVTKDGIILTVDKPFDAKAHAALFRYLTEMGLSPVSRSKVKVDKPPAAASGFDKLQ